MGLVTDLDSAIQFGTSAVNNPCARNVTVRNMHVTGTEMAIIVWDATSTNILVEDSTVTGAVRFAVRYEAGQVTLRNIVSTGSAVQGFYSSLGANPPGVTFDNVSLR